ncbi:hypothetical protein F4779DRAFT_631683 [Xylariaceae sp. FL0662B]|nr:hypothetical protein F4779DRAFT_631683 [Xylariaceae sp. FL0662B]
MAKNDVLKPVAHKKIQRTTRSRRAGGKQLTKAALLREQRAVAKAEAAKEKLREQRREARKVELPTHPQDDVLVLHMTQITRKRVANAAYDDRSATKRAKVDSNGNSKPASRRRFPWEKNKKLEQPPNPFDFGLMAKAIDIDPTEAMGDLGKLPTEIRDDIFSYILVWPDDIPVFRGWLLVYPRERPRLDLSLLYTCRVLLEQGLRILFGENTFVYVIRDPSDHHHATSRVLDGVFGSASAVPINRYGHLIRHVKIRVPANRLDGYENRDRFARAVQKFLPGHGLFYPANLHTLTLDVPALTSRDLGYDAGPRTTVPVARILKPESDVAKALMRLHVQFVRVRATDKHGSVLEHVVDLRSHYKQRLRRLEEEEEDGGRYSDKVARDVSAMEKYVEKQVSAARAQLYSISTRLQELALLGVSKANEKRQYWTDASTSQSATSTTQDVRSRSPVYTMTEEWLEQDETTSTDGSSVDFA